MEQHRQGDILFVKISDKTEVDTRGMRKVKSKTVARGETTGHAHRLAGGEQAQVLVQRGGDMFIVADENSAIEHEEHPTIKLSPGVWRVYRQRELDPLGDVRRVVD
jgi:hypothetical protein